MHNDAALVSTVQTLFRNSSNPLASVPETSRLPETHCKLLCCSVHIERVARSNAAQLAIAEPVSTGRPRRLHKGMAKGNKQQQAAKPVGDKQPDADALQAELKSFASGLGFAAGGANGGFDDSDFRPPAAGLRSKTEGRVRQSAQGKANKKPSAAVPGHKGRAVANSKPQQPGTAEQETETPDVVRERNWNAGVGARPGISSPQTSQSLPSICCALPEISIIG